MLKTLLMRIFLLVFTVFLCSCSSYIYVVRHAEKATPMGNNSDVPLTPAGEERAKALRDSLKHKNIELIYSTNTIRTKNTAEPTAQWFHLSINTYNNASDSSFIATLKHSKKNILVVGHSNTVDDIVNRICGRQLIARDLMDIEYDNLFVLKRNGKSFHLTRKRYGREAH
jgi:broad specificity phosphatase PhoE